MFLLSPLPVLEVCTCKMERYV